MTDFPTIDSAIVDRVAVLGNEARANLTSLTLDGLATTIATEFFSAEDAALKASGFSDGVKTSLMANLSPYYGLAIKGASVANAHAQNYDAEIVSDTADAATVRAFAAKLT